jgi:VCBS repeat-containing protein
MSSDIQSTFVEAAAADTDGISTAAAVGNNANLVLGGALTSGGAVTFDEPRNITILSAGDDSGISFTVTGTDETATAVTESITGANAGTTAGDKFFTTISQIAAVGNPAGNVSAGSGASIAAPIFRGRMRLRGLYAVNTGTAGTITFKEGSGTGTVRMQFNTVASANTTQYPDVPEDGILFVGGGYITYSVAGLSSMTVFYEG